MFFTAMIILFTAIEWVIIIGLAAVIAAALVALIYRSRGASAPSTSSSTPEGREAVQNATNLISALAEAGRSPTAEECSQLRAWHNVAQGGGISNDVLRPMQEAIGRLCPN
jgi:hypothetical protein